MARDWRARTGGSVLVALALLLVASSAEAQPTAAPPPPPDTPSPWTAPPPSVGSSTELLGRRVVFPPEVRYDPSPGARYLLEGLAGLGMGTGFALVAGLLTAAAIPPSTSGDLGTAIASSIDRTIRIALFASLAYTFGQPLGVVLAGRARGGNGGYGWSLLGTLGGNLAGNLVLFGLGRSCDSASTESLCDAVTILGVVLAFGLSATGAVLGYELSNDQRHLREPLPSARLRWAPTLRPTEGGLTVGVGGLL
ncbi:MAG: hypothetical protein HY909_21710 [Deltaproteobacteria bacterium]|nr:hypothetical protein [Deltaproteobacteria bacterium]